MSSNKIRGKNADSESTVAHLARHAKLRQPFDNTTLARYETILNFLEEVYQAAGPYKYEGAEKESKRDALILNFTKVVSDCRAILLLSKHGLYIQAGIIARSASDACHLMVHLALAEKPPEVLSEWLQRKRVTHWKLLQNIQEQVEGELNLGAYAKERSQLDGFVHGNYDGIRLYPAQVGAAPMSAREWHDITCWDGLVHLFLFSCLMVVDLISAKLARKSGRHTRALIKKRTT